MPPIHSEPEFGAPSVYSNAVTNLPQQEYEKRPSDIVAGARRASRSASYIPLAQSNRFNIESRVPKTAYQRLVMKLKGRGVGHRSEPSVNNANTVSRDMCWLWAKLTLPFMLIVVLTTWSIPLLLISSVVPILFAFLQGFARMMIYRLRHSSAPVPMAPSHGVVKCKSLKGSVVHPLGYDAIDDPVKAPLRLLLIGDSLAIGVGQSSSCTPLMPQAIAKEISKEYGGRPVIWTCHGAPGAPTGWIIRELEKSILNCQLQKRGEAPMHMGNWNVDAENYDLSSTQPSSCSCDSSSLTSSSEVSDDEAGEWQNKLEHPPFHSDPAVLAPFDIAVVLIGSNDLKNAAFPFMVKDKDSYGVAGRAGDYAQELQRLLSVLSARMRKQILTFKESAEAARDKVQESMDTVVDLTFLRQSWLRRLSSKIPKTNALGATETVATFPCNEAESFSTDESINSELTKLLDTEGIKHRLKPSDLPIVVLPGLPVESLQTFDTFPLRYFVKPMFDIIDGHKRNLASQHEGEVLFVEPPTRRELAEYSSKIGPYWMAELDDDVLLNEDSVNTKDKLVLEEEMRKYFAQNNNCFHCSSSKKRRHLKTVSVDGIHPNDQGYNFWGRYIGMAIVQEWNRRQIGIQIV